MNMKNLGLVFIYSLSKRENNKSINYNNAFRQTERRLIHIDNNSNMELTRKNTKNIIALFDRISEEVIYTK